MSKESFKMFVRGYQKLAAAFPWLGTVVLKENSAQILENTRKVSRVSSMKGMYTSKPSKKDVVKAALGVNAVQPVVMSVEGDKVHMVLSPGSVQAAGKRDEETTAEEKEADAARCKHISDGKGLLGELRAPGDLMTEGILVGAQIKPEVSRKIESKPPPPSLQAPTGVPGEPNATMHYGNMGKALYEGSAYFKRIVDCPTITGEGVGPSVDAALREFGNILSQGDAIMDWYAPPVATGGHGIVRCSAQGVLIGGARTFCQVRMKSVKGDHKLDVSLRVCNILLIDAAAMGEEVPKNLILGAAHPMPGDPKYGIAGPPSEWSPHHSWGGRYEATEFDSLPQLTEGGKIAGSPVFGSLPYPGSTAAITDHAMLEANKLTKTSFENHGAPRGLSEEAGWMLLDPGEFLESGIAFREYRGALEVAVPSPYLAGWRVATEGTCTKNRMDRPDDRIIAPDFRMGFHPEDCTFALKFTARIGYISSPLPIKVLKPKVVTLDEATRSALASRMARAWGADIPLGQEMPALDLKALSEIVKRQVCELAGSGHPEPMFGRKSPEMSTGPDADHWALGVFANLAFTTAEGTADRSPFLPICSLNLASALADQTLASSNKPIESLFAQVAFSPGQKITISSESWIVFDLGDLTALVDEMSGEVGLIPRLPGEPCISRCEQGRLTVDSGSRMIVDKPDLSPAPEGTSLVPLRGISIGEEVVKSASRPRVEAAINPSDIWRLAFPDPDGEGGAEEPRASVSFADPVSASPYSPPGASWPTVGRVDQLEDG